MGSLAASGPDPAPLNGLVKGPGLVRGAFGNEVVAEDVPQRLDIISGMAREDIALRFVIRISLVVFIQLLSYFFLRLYRYCFFEIKYFQNEISNAEFKMIALLTAAVGEGKTLISKVCQDLAKTERSFVLKKGETTVGLKREELELDYEETMITRLEALSATGISHPSQLAAWLTAVPSTRQSLRKAVGTTWLHWRAVAY
jgi:hypothetical protein